MKVERDAEMISAENKVIVSEAKQSTETLAEITLTKH